LRRSTIDIALRPEHAEAFALSGQSLLPIQGHELDRRRFILGGDKSRSQLESIGGSQRVGLDDPFRMTSHEIDGRDFGPPVPRDEQLLSGGLETPSGGGLVTPTAGKSREQLRPCQGPHDHVRIVSEPTFCT
jgi:hypothetical protein